ncbi:hypothetical protein ASE63_17980 [Bosea sp. Root381]|uniref:hypothetical protein n=1 Tax=Bosea sp. Root381 TaxID=1736524 RepID=UPI0006F6C1AB|nr:hypothetical protein [Bosea sp. Root381]KRE13897.1 hypothetical protein ASE63_17980 [Bosea sp. Root381]
MPPPRRLERMVMAGLCLVGLSGLAWLAFGIVGWLGVGTLGLFVLFVAIRVDLEADRPVGPQMTPGLYASQYRDEAHANERDRAGRRFDVANLLSATRIALFAGVGLAAVGFGMLFLA